MANEVTIVAVDDFALRTDNCGDGVPEYLENVATITQAEMDAVRERLIKAWDDLYMFGVFEFIANAPDPNARP